MVSVLCGEPGYIESAISPCGSTPDSTTHDNTRIHTPLIDDAVLTNMYGDQNNNFDSKCILQVYVAVYTHV